MPFKSTRGLTVLAIFVFAIAVLALPGLHAQDVPSATRADVPRVTAQVKDYDFDPTEPLLEAFDRFELTEVFALNARKDAADLNSFVHEPEAFSWKSHAVQLNRIRMETNEIGDQLQHLNGLEQYLLPRQKLALSHIRVDEEVLAAEVTGAIDFLNNARGQDWDSRYKAYVAGIYERADAIAQAADMSESRLNVQQYLNSSS